MRWPTTEIQAPHGLQQAIAPLIISASRATDIPAFHAKWFMERLRAGYCVWINPFNRKMRQYVSLQQSKAIVFWSKNPGPLLRYLAEIADRGLKFYFQFTLNNYVQENLEPNVPPLEARLETFVNLSELLGKERIIWRFDPICLGKGLTPDAILEKIDLLGQKLSCHTEKLVFSFADIAAYTKVQNNLRQKKLDLREPSYAEMIALVQGLVATNAKFRIPLTLAACAEKIDLTAYGIQHNKCIDGDLICRICKDDPAVLAFFKKNAQQAPLLNELKAARPVITTARFKDPGQRRACGCVASKDIGAYGTCPHMCVYCYANPTGKSIPANISKG